MQPPFGISISAARRSQQMTIAFEPRQSARLAHCRHEHSLDEPPVELLDHRTLQRFSRADPREDAALRQAEPLRNLAERQAFEPLGGRHREGNVDDRGERNLAAASCGFDVSRLCPC
jgi:hypothetical protein